MDGGTLPGHRFVGEFTRKSRDDKVSELLGTVGHGGFVGGKGVSPTTGFVVDSARKGGTGPVFEDGKVVVDAGMAEVSPGGCVSGQHSTGSKSSFFKGLRPFDPKGASPFDPKGLRPFEPRPEFYRWGSKGGRQPPL
jgi:hypothetical protein